MAKKEVKTDLWVASQLDKCKIQFTAQGSEVKEINEALSTASKRGTGNAGYPEYVAVVNPGFPRIHTSLTLTIRPETLGNIEFNCIFTCHLVHSVV